MPLTKELSQEKQVLLNKALEVCDDMNAESFQDLAAIATTQMDENCIIYNGFKILLDLETETVKSIEDPNHNFLIFWEIVKITQSMEETPTIYDEFQGEYTFPTAKLIPDTTNKNLFEVIGLVLKEELVPASPTLKESLLEIGEAIDFGSTLWRPSTIHQIMTELKFSADEMECISNDVTWTEEEVDKYNKENDYDER